VDLAREGRRLDLGREYFLAYTIGTLRVWATISAGAMPLASAVRIMLGWKADRRRASSWASSKMKPGSMR
jgi:hypothetical protein